MLKIENIKFNQIDFNQLYVWCSKYQKEHGYPPMVTFLHFSNDLDFHPCFWLRDCIIDVTPLNDVRRGVEEVRRVDFGYISRSADVDKDTVDAIYRPAGFQDLNAILKGDVANLAVVYKRKQPAKEMTIAQIEKELGYSIKVVKETKEG